MNFFTEELLLDHLHQLYIDAQMRQNLVKNVKHFYDSFIFRVWLLVYFG